MSHATALQVAGWGLLSIGLGLWMVWVGIAAAGVGVFLFGLAAEAGQRTRGQVGS